VSGLESPCRLFVYLARDAPLGVVLRRGPSDWVRLSLWHTDVDAFEHGQWMKARVYERRSDLSADGSLFLAFVRRSSGPASGNTDSWVAISRPPWFTALARWNVGGTYYTGGFFPDGRTLWLGFDPKSPDQGTLPGWLPATTALPAYIDRSNNWTERTVWNNRLIRDGWTRTDETATEVWERPGPDGTRTLVMTLTSATNVGTFGGRYLVEYAVRDEAQGTVVPLGQATWADWDQNGRVVIAQGGRLMSWTPLDERHVIADFNPQLPQPEAAPDQAKEWPG
jgi:hypothetical protein